MANAQGNAGNTPSYIAIPRSSSSQQHGDTQGMVGSPEQVNDLSEYNPPRFLSELPPYSNSSPSLPSGPRPGFSRSISTQSALHRAEPSTSIHSLTRTVIRRNQEHPKEREWTLFGEVMTGDRHSLLSSLPTTPVRPVYSPLPTPLEPPELTQTAPDAGVTTISSIQESSSSQTVHPLSVAPSMDISDTSSEGESDDSEEQGNSGVTDIQQNKRSWFTAIRVPTLTPLQRNILKCSIAYFIGSLFTFSPYLSRFISDVTSYGKGESGPSPSGHMVATVAVYFNPAKTVGGMLEADAFCLMGLAWATFISLSSMGMFWFFEVRAGWEWLADTLVILWIGVGMSIVAWMKLWMTKPTFNTACSMTAIILFVVVVKEGGIQTLMQVALIVFVGSVISNLVCYTIWPQRATRNLQDTMTKTLESFATLLTMITQTFLLEEPVHQPSQEKIQRAIDSHQASFTALKKNLAEAQSERWVGGPGKPTVTRSRTNLGQAYEDAVDSLNRLGQHLNGLRGGTSLQYELIQANKEGKLVLRNHRSKAPSSAALHDSISASGKGFATDHESTLGPSQTEEDIALLQAAADTFGDLVADLGPPLKSLSSTCTSTLKKLKEAFAQPQRGVGTVSIDPEAFGDLADSLERALFQFESTSNHAILRLYTKGAGSSRVSTVSVPSDDNPVTTGDDSENIFLVYFFIFTLQEFAKELASLVDAMGRICSIQRAQSEGRSWWQTFLLPFSYMATRVRMYATMASAQREKQKGIRKRFSAIFAPPPKPNTVSFPKIKPHAPNTVQTPARENLSFVGRIKQTIWAIGSRMQEQDMKYAFKAGMALSILAAPAFFDSTRPIFTEYRGEWALISFFVVLSPTIGATNFLGIHRVLGTLLGAVTAAVVWSAFPENPYVLSAFGFFYSMPCFYYIVAKPQYATSARFVLLTYNLTCLYCYNLRQEDVSVIWVASHRFVAVTVGVVWAAIVSRYWWPTEARRELSKALGEFCLNVGWLYTRLVAFNSFENSDESGYSPIEEDVEPTEETSLLRRSTNANLNESIMHFMAMELHLQIKLIELQGLLAQTQHEPRLKGPFPVKLYRSILTSLQVILDKLHSMRCVTSREEWHTTVRTEFIIPVNKERRDMVGNIILYFSTLAAAFRLKSPLPPYLPPAEPSRQRLVDAIRKLDVIKNRNVRGSRHLLFFAYAITMRGVIHELDYLGKTLQEAFGVIGGSTEAFEALFRDEVHRPA
ncbi:hypothetical protein K474DRAFT_1663382 [Panus rudis PR-1116 ss-1]|nr:hypothetical protein K474DRAFT_1663382 [Panus rudis PR-1116 ss-1]